MESSHAPLDSITRKRVINIVILTVFLDMIGFGLILPLLPLYIKNLGGSPQVVGLLFTCFAGTQLFSTPILGRLSDHYGRRSVILLSLLGNALSMALFAIADQLWVVFVSRIMAGATAGNLSACQAAIADITSREERATGMGKVGAGIGLGMVLGPVIGGLLAQFGTWAPPTAAAMLAVIDLVLAFFLMPETRFMGNREAATARGTPGGSLDVTEARDWKSIMRSLTEPRLLRVMLMIFLAFCCIANLQVAIALLAHDRLQWNERQIAYIFALFGFVTVMVQGGFIGKLAGRFGEIRLVTLGGVSAAIGMLAMSIAHAPWVLLLGCLFFALGNSVTNPSLTSLASRYSPADIQGTALGITQSAGGLARTVGPAISGALYAHLNPGAPFVWGAGLALLSSFISLTLAKNAAPVQ